MKLLNVAFLLILMFGSHAFAQNINVKHQKVKQISEAYVVLIKEKAQAKGDLYEANRNFSAETVQVKSAALRVALIDREVEKLSRIKSKRAKKLSQAFGSLLLTKIQYEVELYELRQRFFPQYIAVKKKEIQLESLTKDLEQISKNLH